MSRPGQCTITDSIVKTFDDVTYTRPEMPTMCETILARDCTSVGKWMVTISPLSTMSSITGAKKMVRLMVPHYEFKIMPGSMSYGPMTLYVNGMPKEILSSQPMMLPETASMAE